MPRAADLSTPSTSGGSHFGETLTYQPGRGGRSEPSSSGALGAGLPGNPIGHRSEGNPGDSRGRQEQPGLRLRSSDSESESDSRSDDPSEKGRPSSVTSTDGREDYPQDEDTVCAYDSLTSWVRSFHKLPSPEPVQTPRELTGFEQQSHVPQETKTPMYLPYSEATRARLMKTNTKLKAGCLDSVKGQKLFGVRTTTRRKFYDSCEGFPSSSDHTQRWEPL